MGRMSAQNLACDRELECLNARKRRMPGLEEKPCRNVHISVKGEIYVVCRLIYSYSIFTLIIGEKFSEAMSLCFP